MVLRVLITIFPVILLFYCFCSLKNNTTLLDRYVERIPKINLTKFLRSSHIILERHVYIIRHIFDNRNISFFFVRRNVNLVIIQRDYNTTTRSSGAVKKSRPLSVICM